MVIDKIGPFPQKFESISYKRAVKKYRKHSPRVSLRNFIYIRRVRIVENAKQ